jgi:hypothetical protein
MASRSSNHASRQRTKPVRGVGYSTCMLLGSEYSTDPHARTIEEPVTAEVTGQLGPCQLGPCATHWGSRLGPGVSESPGSQVAGCQLAAHRGSLNIESYYYYYYYYYYCGADSPWGLQSDRALLVPCHSSSFLRASQPEPPAASSPSLRLVRSTPPVH